MLQVTSKPNTFNLHPLLHTLIGRNLDILNHLELSDILYLLQPATDIKEGGEDYKYLVLK